MIPARGRFRRFWIAALLAAACGSAVALLLRDAPPGTETAIAAPAAGWSGEWPLYGGDQAQMRFVDNTEINVANVARLRPKWVFQTGGGSPLTGTPVVRDGVMYVTTGTNTLFAVDARTGRRLWRYEHKLGTTALCCGPGNRGAAVDADSVYMATLDAQLVALDRRDGSVRWTAQVADPAAGYGETVAPTLYRNAVILGVSGGEFAIRGFISAYDKDSGALLWRWHTIPAPDEAAPDGIKGWEGAYREKADGITPLSRDIAAEKTAVASGRFADAWKTGGGPNWTTNSVDLERGIVFALIGNPAPSFDGSVRPGDNRWTNSMVALEAATGRMLWGYQYVPHDRWDLDAASPAILAEVRDDRGQLVPAAIHAGKTSWVYVHDRLTGALIRRSDPISPDPNRFAVPGKKGGPLAPTVGGGVDWAAGSFNPNTRLAYYSSTREPRVYFTAPTPNEAGKAWVAGGFEVLKRSPTSGLLSAVNVDTGKIAWQVPLPGPIGGGTLTTAGNLVFAGGARRDFNAFDARTGALLWSFILGASVYSAPMAFEVDGKLHIAVAAGGSYRPGTQGQAVVAFALE